MDLVSLFNAGSAAIVVGGTLLATVLRCGPASCAVTARAVAQLGRRTFDADAARAEMAVQLRDIDRDGLLRAEVHRFGDSEFDEATGALIGSRSVKALLDAHERHRQARMASATKASATLAQAAELAPVFGMVGTLLALSQMSAEGLAQGGVTGGGLTGAVSMAVLTTLYGLLLANLLLAPLARAIERSARAEEEERQRIVDWLAAHLERGKPATLKGKAA